MPSLEKINFINPNSDGYQSLVHCWANSFSFTEAHEILRRHGFELLEEQYSLFCQLLDIQVTTDLKENHHG